MIVIASNQYATRLMQSRSKGRNADSIEYNQYQGSMIFSRPVSLHRTVQTRYLYDIHEASWVFVFDAEIGERHLQLKIVTTRISAPFYYSLPSCNICPFPCLSAHDTLTNSELATSTKVLSHHRGLRSSSNKTDIIDIVHSSCVGQRQGFLGL